MEPAPPDYGRSTPVAHPVRTVARLQAASGILFGTFLALHLSTTASAALGLETYDRVLVALRRVYAPTIWVEGVLIGVTAATHIGCGFYRLRYRRSFARPAKRPPLFLRLHRVSGYLLVLFFGGHVFATRILPAFSTAPTATGRADGSFLAFSLINWPAAMIPYYLLLGGAGALHFSLGIGVAAQTLFPRRISSGRVRRVRRILIAVLVPLVLFGVVRLAMLASSADRSRFDEFRALYRQYLPMLPPKPE